MRLGYGAIFADAGSLWRSEHGVLVPVAGIFFFLPVFALLLFLPVADTRGLAEEAARAAEVAQMTRNLPWLFGQIVVQAFGAAVVLQLLLDPDRPQVGAAIVRAVRLLPGLLAAQIIAFAAIALGLLILIVPGLYLMGRTFITSPIYVAEPGRGPAGAAILSFERTHGNGWVLFAVSFTVSAVNYLLGSIAQQATLTLLASGPSVTIPFDAGVSVLAAACVLAMVLLQAAAYRALPVPKTGPKTGM